MVVKNKIKTSKRIFWVDMLRGIAVLMMLIYHFFFDLDFLGIKKINLSSFAWILFARSIAVIFIFLVGFSLVLSFEKTKRITERKTKKMSQKKYLLRKYLLRGIKIFFYGMIITAATYIFLEEGFIVFGILHFIGISIIISHPFLKAKNKVILALAIFSIALGIVIENISFDTNLNTNKSSYLLLIFGIPPKNFYSLDYWPLFPWLGIVFIGIFFGNVFFKNKSPHNKFSHKFLYKSSEKLKKLEKKLKKLHITIFICFLGTHSLLIYFLHQPILLGLLTLFA